MDQARASHACGAVSGGAQVVVVGGYRSSTSEIYDVEGDFWRPGPYLPIDLQGAASLQVKLCVEIMSTIGLATSVSSWMALSRWVAGTATTRSSSPQPCTPTMRGPRSGPSWRAPRSRHRDPTQGWSGCRQTPTSALNSGDSCFSLFSNYIFVQYVQMLIEPMLTAAPSPWVLPVQRATTSCLLSNPTWPLL